MFKKKKKYLEEKEVKKIGISLFIIAIIFITILLIYCIYMFILVKGINERISNNSDVETNEVVKNNEFEEVTINSESYYLNDSCSKNCYIKIKSNQDEYYYVIVKENEDYVLSIYNLYKKIDTINLGIDISNLNVSYYNEYILFKTIKNDNTSTYDVYIFFNGIKTDIFESLNANEIEMIDDNIIYYSVACKPGSTLSAYKIKYQRKPFDSNVTILSIEDTRSSMC